MTASIQSLPAELLFPIISASAEIYGAEMTHDMLGSFAMVCKSWLHFVLSTPLLWSNLYWGFESQHLDSTEMKRRYRCLENSLSRSGDTPLHLNFCFSYDPESLSVEQASALDPPAYSVRKAWACVKNSSGKHLERCVSMCIIASSIELIECGFPFGTSRDFPNLQEIVLLPAMVTGIEELVSDPFILPKPEERSDSRISLRHLDIKSMGAQLPVFDSLWETISRDLKSVTITLQEWGLQRGLQCLAACTNLHYLDLSIPPLSDLHSETFETMQPVELESLQHLSIEEHLAMYFRFSYLIRAPLLSTLLYQGDFSEDIVIGTNEGDFVDIPRELRPPGHLTGCYPSLREFTVVDTNEDAWYSVKLFLDSNPSLQKLSFQTHANASFLSSLLESFATDSMAANDFLPQLTHIESIDAFGEASVQAPEDSTADFAARLGLIHEVVRQRSQLEAFGEDIDSE